MKIGCGTVVFRKYELRRALDAIRKAGYEYFETQAINPWCPHVDIDRDDPVKLAELAREFGFKGITALFKDINESNICVAPGKGTVMLAVRNKSGFKEMPLTHIYSENSRGLGVADMAQCILDNRTDLQANAYMANHVLEAMCGIEKSSAENKYYYMTTKCPVPKPLSRDILKGFVV